MGAGKSNKSRKEVQYVKNRNRTGQSASVIVRRSLAVAVLVVFAGFLCFGVVQGFFWLERALFSENPTFEVQTIEIEIEGSKFSESDIRELGGLYEGMNLFAVELADLKKKYLQSPDIASVQIERHLLNTLRVQVKERYPVARVDSVFPSLKSCLIDKEGYLLEYRANLGRVPRIVGLKRELEPGKRLHDEKVDVALEVIQICNEHPRWDSYLDIYSIDVSPLDYLKLNLSGGNIAKVPLHSLELELSWVVESIRVYLNSNGEFPQNMNFDSTPEKRAIWAR